MTNIANYFGIGIDKEDMITLLGSHKKRGTALAVLPETCKKLGLRIKRIRFQPKQIVKALRAGKPVVVCYLASENESHFTTIVSVKVRRNVTYYTMNDTLYGVRDMPAEGLHVLMKLDESWARVVEKA